MNPVLVGELANRHISGLRDEAARRASQAEAARSRRAGRHRGLAPLRRQVGFVLIEAGLRLVTR
ncbi:MAG TPA: hypothetical protein VF060_17150 [Trebonia sp.]